MPRGDHCWVGQWSSKLGVLMEIILLGGGILFIKKRSHWDGIYIFIPNKILFLKKKGGRRGRRERGGEGIILEQTAQETFSVKGSPPKDGDKKTS